ncbi:hypothetical protein GCM10009548_26820 [Streptomyces malaysiensis subsp. malaysiensis]
MECGAELAGSLNMGRGCVGAIATRGFMGLCDAEGGLVEGPVQMVGGGFGQPGGVQELAQRAERSPVGRGAVCLEDEGSGLRRMGRDGFERMGFAAADRALDEYEARLPGQTSGKRPPKSVELRVELSGSGR